MDMAEDRENYDPKKMMEMMRNLQEEVYRLKAEKGETDEFADYLQKSFESWDGDGGKVKTDTPMGPATQADPAKPMGPSGGQAQQPRPPSGREYSGERDVKGPQGKVNKFLEGLVNTLFISEKKDSYSD